MIGAGVPLNTLIKVLEDQASVVSGYKVLADHVRKVNKAMLHFQKYTNMQINKCTPMRTATINVLDEYTSDLFYSDNDQCELEKSKL